MKVDRFTKTVVLLNGAVPVLLLGWDAWAGRLGANPVNFAIRTTGILALIFLLLSLAVTPASRLTGWGWLGQFRRMLGLYAFFHAALHFLLFFGLDRAGSVSDTASEVVKRPYLLVGMVGLVLMVPLAATSTDGMIRRLGGERWNRLHRLVYPIAILGIIHFLMQTKLDISESVMVAGFLFWLLGYRLIHRYAGGVTYVWSAALAAIAAALTAVAEAGWYGATTGVMWWRVFAVNFDWEMAMRPSHWVLAVGLGVTLASYAWSFKSQRPTARRVASRAPAGAVQVQSGS